MRVRAKSRKFLDAENRQAIIDCPGPNSAAEKGRDSSRKIRKDWNDVRDEIMYETLRYKFDQNKQLKQWLLGTADAELIEHTDKDAYWADGGDGSGLNKLGLQLMKLRDFYNRTKL